LFRCITVFIILPVLIAIVLETNDSHVIFFGEVIDSPCAFKEKHGLPCGSCGMTRSWASSAEFRFEDAKNLNPYGPISFWSYVFWSLSTILVIEYYLRIKKRFLVLFLFVIGLAIVCFMVGFYPVFTINSELLRQYEGFELKPDFSIDKNVLE
jgi:hypothetical protein